MFNVLNVFIQQKQTHPNSGKARCMFPRKMCVSKLGKKKQGTYFSDNSNVGIS